VKIKSADLRDFYIGNKEDFRAYLLTVRRIGRGKIRDYINAIDKKLIEIRNTIELKTHLSQAYTDPYGRALRNRFNFMEYKEIEQFNNILIEKWKKSITFRKSGVRENYINDNELKEAYQSIKRRNIYTKGIHSQFI